jgi:hypothetical protein
MRHFCGALALLFFSVTITFGQAQPLENVHIKKDTLRSLNAWMQRGTLSLHHRTFLMGTANQGELSDYYALATGLGTGFKTARIYGLSFGVSGNFYFNLASNVQHKDSTTNGVNRYEAALFDVADLEQRSMYRLEELYVRYHISKSRVTVGKMFLNTPFINLQDGRMGPTLVEGVWAETENIKWLRIEGGWLWKVSPRGTMRWYTVGESIGLYPTGLNTDGTKSNYPGQLSSKGVGVVAIHFTPHKNHHTQLWNYTIENMANTFFAKHESRFRLKGTHHIMIGAQYTRQDALKNGGNIEPRKTFIDKGASANIISGRIAYEQTAWKAGLNYTRITSAGRFLMPREWGREPLYTFMPRERNDGLGNVHAMTADVSYKLPKTGLTASLTYGLFLLPDVKDVRLNKYGMPSYHQVKGMLNYVFKGKLNGLNIQALYVFKKEVKTNLPLEAKYVFNKVDLHHFNLVVNYTIQFTRH